MNQVDRVYRELGLRLLAAPAYEGRHGKMRGLVGETLRVDLRQGFPVLTTKAVNWRAAFMENVWFLSGSDDILDLVPHSKIWNPWIGSNYVAYGHEWRRTRGYDQLRAAVDMVKKDHGTRRAIFTAWTNVKECHEADLPPCHAMCQILVRHGQLHVVVFQRSADFCVGVPFNLVGYALIAHLIGNELGLPAGTLTFHYGDLHVYESHVKNMRIQLDREGLPSLPTLVIPRDATIDNLSYDDVRNGLIAIEDYSSLPAIKYEVYV